jgi:nucleotide-binding universal stress UspA family protein
MATWKPIVAGVDGSPQAAGAAALAWRIAGTAGTDCYFVHGAHPLLYAPAVADFMTDADALVDRQVESARAQVVAALRDALPPLAQNRVDVRLGRAAAVVVHAAHECNAGLIVLGGKHHSTLGRWMGGSTAQHVVRTTDIPLLVTGSRPGPITRILVAADLSYAVRPTFEAAARMARLFGAELRVLHAVEPLPVFAEMPMVLDDAAFYDDSRQQFERCLEPLLEQVPAQAVLRRGHAADALAAEAAEWGADLVAVGAHGKGWVDRLLMGSTTERLLDQLPASLLVIPVPPPAGERRPGRAVRRARLARQRAAGGTVL